ncbi:hypothetical protein JVU11DRAFT_3859 [Chiua virens]|nr:hypothetical protein JVU11DRAFT_3859 [Chiua virens]
MVKNIPRHAILKPAHAIYRLQHQHFALGDRVTMVQDSGGVPLSVKGVVVGLNSKSMDVVWDVPFMAGVTLGDRYWSDQRCSQYRGSAVQFSSCLNLTNPQFIASMHPTSVPPPSPNVPFKPRSGPYPAVRPPSGQPAAAGFRPAPQRHVTYLLHLLSSIAVLTTKLGNHLRLSLLWRTPTEDAAQISQTIGHPSQRDRIPQQEVHLHQHGRQLQHRTMHLVDMAVAAELRRGDAGRGLSNGHSATGALNHEHGHPDASGSGTRDEDGEVAEIGYRPLDGPVRRGGYSSRGTRGRGFAPTFERARGRGGFRGRGRGSYAVPT